jgi:regulatory protein
MQKIRIGKEQAIQRIRHYCAYQERAQQEVRDKLYELGMTMSEVEEIIADLITDNFLNEARFAESFAGGHFRIKAWGKQKIKYALQQKRVSPVNIKKALNSIEEEVYKKTLVNLATKKWNSLKGERGMSRMAKTNSFLNQRGFESALIMPILQALNKK